MEEIIGIIGIAFIFAFLPAIPALFITFLLYNN